MNKDYAGVVFMGLKDYRRFFLILLLSVPQAENMPYCFGWTSQITDSLGQPKKSHHQSPTGVHSMAWWIQRILHGTKKVT